MNPFSYERPAGIEDAIDSMTKNTGAAFLGGGTNLVDHMKLGIASPTHLIDVAGLGLDTIEETTQGALRIGATVRNSDLAVHPAIRARYPVLTRALLAGASPQLRNLATTGGNLMQRTRCPYFQDLTTPCNKRTPGESCSAREGHNRDHAILGASEHCVATHPSDMAVALVALDAEAVLAGPDGERRVAIENFHRLPGDEPQRDTVLGPGELIVAVDIPPLPVAKHSDYRKVRDRASYAFALVSVAAALELRDGVVQDVRLALGGVAHKPWRARIAEEALRGGPPSADLFRRAAEAELAAAKPLPDNGYKVPMARNVIVSTLCELQKRDERS